MLILKQNTASSVPTPPAGKGTIFLNTNDDIAVKDANGSVTTFPTAGGSNTQVYFNDDGSFGANANLTFNKSTSVFTVTGNVAATNVLSDNLLYANGQPWDLSDPGGSNTQIQFNDDESFGGSANFTWDKSSNTLTVTGTSNVTGNLNVTANATFDNANAGNLLTANFVAGTLTTAAQPNITSVGLLTGLLVGSTANASDFPNAVMIVSQDNSGQSHAENIGLVGEAVADSGNTSTWGIGVLGEARANGATKATGVQGGAYVTNTADTGAAVGVRGYATMTHAGGFNVGVLGNAAGSGLGNYAFYIQEGNVASIENDTLWDLIDNSTTAFAFNSTGKANILAISTEDGLEGVSMSGTLDITGNASAGNISTGGVLSVTGNANVGNLGTAGLVVATGNVSGGNLTTAGVVAATGNVSGGNLTTAGVVAATGNVSGGNLTTAGALNVTGNANVGNLGTAGLVVATGNVSGGNLTTAGGVVASTLTSNVATGTAPLTVTSTTRVANLNVAYANVSDYVGAGSAQNGNFNIALISGTSGNVQPLGNTAFIANASNGSLYATTFVGALTGAATTAGTVTTAAQPNITSVGTLTSLTVSGNASAGNISTGGSLSATGNVSGGNLTTAGALSVTGNANVGNIGAAAAVFTSVSGNGSALTALNASNISSGTLDQARLANAAVTLGSTALTLGDTVTTVTGLSSVTSTTFVGALTGAATTAGTVTTAAQPNITSTGTLTSLTVSGNTSSNNITTTNGITVGNGLTVSAGGANITGNISVTGNMTVSGNLNYSNVTDLVVGDPLIFMGANNAGDTVDLGFVAEYNDGAEKFTGFARDASDSSRTWMLFTDLATQPTTTIDFASATMAPMKTGAFTSTSTVTATGNVSGGNLTTAGVVAATGNVSGGNLTTAGALSVTGNANVGNIGAAAGVFTSVSGNGAALTALNASNVSSGTLDQARLANAAVTLGSTALTLGATVTTVTGLSSVTSTSFVGALTGAATTAGTVTTAAQPNITSTGTLTGLTIAANGNIAMSGSASQISGVGLVSSTLFAGSGANLTTLNASNVSSGTLDQARLANSSVTLGSTALTLGATVTSVTGLSSVTSTTFVGALTGAATTAGTVTTAAQPNITSVGTLTSLSVTGNVSAGNVTSTGTIGGAGAIHLGGTLTTGGNTTAGTVTGNWTLSAGSRWNATYADLAEKYVADKDYEPGTVLVFGGEFEVTEANAFDSTRVAGVVSTDPAYIMNAGCEGEHVAILALQGRVPVKVLGPVEKGDLMVSAQNGYAIANNEARAGTIIGKSLENFTGEIGVIEVVIGRF